MVDDSQKTTKDKIMNSRKKPKHQNDGEAKKQVNKQHEGGKLTARERLDFLFDKGTFEEIQLFVKHRSTLFGLDKKDIPSDGVVTGFGKINEQRCFCRGAGFHQFRWQPRRNARQKNLESDGYGIGGASLCGAQRFRRRAYSGRRPGTRRLRRHFLPQYSLRHIPQITAIMGPTAGGAVYSPALTDWFYGQAKFLYITGPDVIKP